MMKKITFSLLAAVITVTGTAFAGPMVTREYKQACVTPCFRDTELQLDLFWSYNAVSKRRQDFDGEILSLNRYRSGSGGGVGFNAFFARYFGLGIEGNWWNGARRVRISGDDIDIRHRVVNQLTGSLILRYPFEGESICWAPYIFGGGGGIFTSHRSSGFGHLGAGAEWRITPYMGLFADWRWEFIGRRHQTIAEDVHVRNNDLNTTRVGVRFVF